MPSTKPGLQQKTMDWRASLAKNSRRTRIVILLFLLIYAAIGLLFDAYWISLHAPNAPLGLIFQALLTFKVIPWATFIALGIAAMCLWITFALHDKIMLLGTRSVRITANENDHQKQQLYNVVEEMKVAAGMAYMPKIYIIKAEYMNAFASGYSEKSAMIAVTQGLLEKLKRDELMAVIAHELSHIRHGDIKLTLTASVLSNLILIFIDILFYGFLFSSDGRSNARSRLFIIIMLLRFTLPLVTLLLMLFLSRTREFMADAGCVELMRDNEPLASALIKIREDSLANRKNYGIAYQRTKHEGVRREAYIFDPIQARIQPAKSPSDLFSTHPGFIKRLAALGFTKSTDNKK